MTAAADHATVADAEDWREAKVLTRDHASTQRDIHPDQRVISDFDPPLTKNGAGGKRHAAPTAEPGEAASRRCLAGDKRGRLNGVPASVHKTRHDVTEHCSRPPPARPRQQPGKPRGRPAMWPRRPPVSP